MARDFDAKNMYTPYRLTGNSFLQISADDKLTPHYMTVSKKEQICHKIRTSRCFVISKGRGYATKLDYPIEDVPKGNRLQSYLGMASD